MNNFQTENRVYSLAAVPITLLVFTALGPWLNNALSWNREGLENWQFWRLFTGHLVHTNLWHGLLNISALAIALYLFGNSESVKKYLFNIIFLCLSISISLYLFEPWLANYVGFSGVLYGIFALYLIKTLQQKPLLNTALFIGLSWKVISQQMPDFDTNYLRSTIQAKVIVEAHCYGYLCGIVLGVAALIRSFNLKNPR
ncbi:MAG: rhombosortase [Cellvibrionaceae bacterium]|nr:rhombosortase [Cellvibrionaceae bacterium]